MNGRQYRQSIVLTFRPTIFYRDAVALDNAGLNQALPEGGCQVRWRRKPFVQKSDGRERLLRPRRKRPRRRAA